MWSLMLVLERNCGVGVVDVHDTNMGFKPPCHFVIVHMKLSYVLVILGHTLWIAFALC